MAKKSDENIKGNKQEFGDIVHNHELIKRTLMASAYPALIKSVTKNGDTLFEGFLPGFEFATIEDVEDENEIVEYLQDMLDDEVEELVVFGKSLPYVEEDEQLLEKYPDYKIVLLDINVYATKEELNYYDECSHNCGSCHHNCGEDDYCEDEFCSCDEDDDDDDCDCHCGENHEHHSHHHFHDEGCDDDCCCKGEHLEEHNHSCKNSSNDCKEGNCGCGNHNKHETCHCKNGKKESNLKTCCKNKTEVNSEKENIAKTKKQSGSSGNGLKNKSGNNTTKK